MVYQYIFKDARLTPQKEPLVTICYLKDDQTGKIAKGIAVCSPTEGFQYIKGRGYAYSRALAAMKQQQSGEYIRGPKGITAIMSAGVSPTLAVNVAKSRWDANESHCLNSEDLATYRRISK